MTRQVVTVNAGASTLKLALLEVAAKGCQERRHTELEWAPADHPGATVSEALSGLEATPDAFGFRVVHGGRDFVDPVTLSEAVEHRLEQLISLAPLHNGPALAAIREVRRQHPHLPAVAVFDTAFHARRPEVSMRYALPNPMVERFDIRRYGFHGLAHASLVMALAEAQGVPAERVNAVTLQLGAGCSACAVRNGRSIETSMGYTPLEGLVMSTRSGDVDPAIVVRLMQEGLEAEQIEQELTRRSGLLALSGYDDMRRVLATASAGDARAQFAVQLFCHRVVMTTGAYLTLLEGDGALVFGGGIGTNSPAIRQRVAQGLAAWDIRLDEERNERNEPGPISAAGSRPVYALRTNEEAIIARAVVEHLGW